MVHCPSGQQIGWMDWRRAARTLQHTYQISSSAPHRPLVNTSQEVSGSVFGINSLSALRLGSFMMYRMPGSVKLFEDTAIKNHKQIQNYVLSFEPRNEKMGLLTCAPTKVSDQPSHLFSLRRAFTVYPMDSLGAIELSFGRRRLCSNCVDLSLRWSHMP